VLSLCAAPLHTSNMESATLKRERCNEKAGNTPSGPKRSRSKMILGETAMENAADIATLEVASDLKRRCGYPDRPLVGELRCAFKRANGEVADEQGNVTFEWTFACQPSDKNSLGVNGELLW
jgi:hypothetical protein